MTLEWHPALSVGHSLLDAQHRRLFRAYADFLGEAGETGDAAREAFHERFNDLVDLLLDHFQVEEAILDRANFPRLIEHRRLHSTMIEDLSEILLATARGVVDSQAAAARVADWIGGHLNEDLQYRAFVSGT